MISHRSTNSGMVNAPNSAPNAHELVERSLPYQGYFSRSSLLEPGLRRSLSQSFPLGDGYPYGGTRFRAVLPRLSSLQSVGSGQSRRDARHASRRLGPEPTDRKGREAREDRPEACSASSDRLTTGKKEPGAFCSRYLIHRSLTTAGKPAKQLRYHRASVLMCHASVSDP
jgi:hypothetical protein